VITCDPVSERPPVDKTVCTGGRNWDIPTVLCTMQAKRNRPIILRDVVTPGVVNRVARRGGLCAIYVDLIPSTHAASLGELLYR
jgi:hypothetical protein